MKILILNMSNLGDVVCGMTVVNSFRNSYSEVSVLLRDETRELLLGQAGINLVSVAEAINETWDILFDLTSSGESRRISRKISAAKKLGRSENIFKRIKNIFVYDINVPKSKYGNIVKNYYPAMEYFKIVYDKVPYLEISPIDVSDKYEKTVHNKKQNIALHVGASTEQKRIPLSLMIDLVRYFKKNDIGVILLGTEKDIANNVIKFTDYYPTYIDVSLIELKYVLNRVDLFIGPDSGVLHVAAAVGAKCIGLYGPTQVKTAGPLSDCFTYIEHDIGCNPCNQKRKCRHSLRCMNTISVDEVVARIEEFLPIAHKLSS